MLFAALLAAILITTITIVSTIPERRVRPFLVKVGIVTAHEQQPAWLEQSSELHQFLTQEEIMTAYHITSWHTITTALLRPRATLRARRRHHHLATCALCRGELTWPTATGGTPA